MHISETSETLTLSLTHCDSDSLSQSVSHTVTDSGSVTQSVAVPGQWPNDTDSGQCSATATVPVGLWEWDGVLVQFRSESELNLIDCSGVETQQSGEWQLKIPLLNILKASCIIIHAKKSSYVGFKSKSPSMSMSSSSIFTHRAREIAAPSFAQVA